MIRVLQIISDTNIGGGGHSLLNYLRFRDRERVEVLVALPRRSALKAPIEALGVETAEIDAMADKSLDWKAVPLLRKLIQSWKPDLVHTHGSLSGRIAARLCGVKVLYTKHCAFPPSQLRTSLPGRLAGRVLDWALSDGVVAIGPSAEENLASTGIPHEKIHVMFNGVEALKPVSPEERQRLREELGFAPEDFVVGILARIEIYKGHGTLLEAVRELAGEGRRVKLLVAGQGSFEPELRLRCADLPPDTVVFAGFVERVERVLGAMDLQVNASYESETSSLSLLEGMSMGLPAVASDCGGNPYLIRDGENGLIFPAGDSGALAERIRRLMDAPEERAEMGRRAREIFQAHFTGETFAKNVEQVYFELLKGATHGTEDT